MTLASLTAPHPGTRCKPKPPPLRKRLLARWHARRQARQVEAARDDAYVVRIEAHAPPPLAEAQVALTALYNVLHHEHGFTVPPLTDAFNQPPAAVQPDEIRAGDDHLRPGQYGDDTHAFSRYVDGGQE